MQGGPGGNTCSDLFRGLGPHLHGNRPTKSTWTTSKRLNTCQEAQVTRWPAQQTACHKQRCPENKKVLLQCIHKIREGRRELEDKVDDMMLRAIFSSLNEKLSCMWNKCILRDPPSPTLDLAAGPSERHNTCSMTKMPQERHQNIPMLCLFTRSWLSSALSQKTNCLAMLSSRTLQEGQNNADMAPPDL